VTSNHSIYSADRLDFVPAGEVRVGETLRNLDGFVRIESIEQLGTEERVYNLEIHGEHVFRVASSGLLVHNSSGAQGSNGGAHGQTKLPWGDGFESHHMPPKSVNGLPPDVGPTIKMERVDHLLTSSHGSRAGSPAYRSHIEDLLGQGKVREAMAIEINDVRRAAMQGSGDLRKYNDGIREMLQYARGIGYVP
jgi:hypothetical protein